MCAPVPSMWPGLDCPQPTGVDTIPPGAISLMQWLRVSATITFPCGSTNTPHGLQNCSKRDEYVTVRLAELFETFRICHRQRNRVGTRRARLNPNLLTTLHLITSKP
eukprot:8083100-Pyramimonas_sp.AAC.1